MSDANTVPMIESPQKRKMSFLLGLGIFLIPIIFAWFTLRQGYSTLARAVSFIWLILTLAVAFAPSSNTSNTSTNYAESASVEANTAQASSNEQSEQPTAPVEQAPQAIQVSANQLFQAYKANEVAADRNFKDQWLEVTGTVQSIESGVSDGADVRFSVGDQYGFESVTASGNADFDNVAANLSKGQQLTVRCKGAGEVMGFPFLNECTVI